MCAELKLHFFVRLLVSKQLNEKGFRSDKIRGSAADFL